MANDWQKTLDNFKNNKAAASSSKASNQSSTSKSTSSNNWQKTLDDFSGSTARKKQYDDAIAPVASRVITRAQKKKKEEEEKKKKKWYEKGHFEDGWDFGDITKTILGIDEDTASLKDLTINSAKRGYYNSLYGEETFKEMGGQKNQKDVYEQILAGDEYQFAPGNDAAGAISGAAELLGQQFRQFTNPRTLALAGTAAGAAAIAGQAGPQVLVPEEIISVPAAAMAGFTTGSSMSNLEIEAGHAYNEMLDAGISEETARKVAMGVGAVNAGLELLQVDELLDAYKVTKASGATKTVTKKIFDELVDRGVDVAKETAQEVAQERVTIAGVQFASEMEKGEKAYSADEVTDRLLDTAKSSALSFGAMNVPAAAKNTVSIVSEQQKANRLTQNEQAVVDKVAADRIADKEKDGTKLTNKEKAAIEEQVVKDMERGYISTDTIEEVLGGDSYSVYKETVDREDAILKEYEELGEKPNATPKDYARYTELTQQVKDIHSNSQRDALRAKLDEDVMGIVHGSRLAESYNERTRRSQKFEADVTKYDAKQQVVIQKAIDSGILNNTNRTHEFVDIISKISADKGVLFDFTNNTKLKESGFAVDGRQVNGFVTKDGISLNIDSPQAWQKTVGHEVTHVLEGTEFYTELQNTLFEYAKTKGEYDSRMKSLTELYKDVQDADINAELTADLVGEYLFTDEKFIKNLSVEHRNVFQKIYDEIKYLYKVATGSKEAKELEKVKRAFEKAYKEGGTTLSDTKYSLTEAFTDSNGTQYDNAVLLDTDFFDGTPPRKWGDKLRTMVNERAADDPFILPIADENGNTTLLQFAKPTDRVKKDGGANHRVLDELSSTSDNISKLAVVHIDEIVSVSEENSPYYTNEHNHQWLDQNGWLHRNANVINQKNGSIYNLTVDIAKAADGRTILYATDGKIKKVGNVDVNSLKIKGSRQNSNFDTKVAQKGNSVKYSLSDSTGRELSPATEKRFGNSKVVDENGSLKVVYHGTASGEFTIFDKAKGSVEGDFGSGFYFTDNEADVSEHYEGGGPDFENKVARLAEQIEAEEDIDYDEADERAREELYKGSHKFEVYLNIENPAIVGKTYLFDSDFGDSYNEEDFDDYDEYIAETEQAVADAVEEIIWEVEKNVDVYSTEGLADVIYEAYSEGGIGIEELKDRINQLYLEDNEGNFVGNEVVRQIIESLGYDGIVDPTVSSKWNMDIEEGTTHYIVFKPNQIKAVTNQNPTDNPDIHRSLSNVGEQHTPDSLSALRLETADDIAPVAEDSSVVAENATTTPTVSEMESVGEDVAPVDVSKSPVLKRLNQKLTNNKTELYNVQKLREDSGSSFDEKITKAKEQLDSKKNKDTKAANNLRRRIERLERLKADVDAEYAKRIGSIKSRIAKTEADIQKYHPGLDRAEKAIARIDRRLEADKAELTEEYDLKREQLADKDSFISQKATELYNEIRKLKKGVKASEQLGYLLDHGYEWSAIKSALINVKHTPGGTVNINSEAESVVREMLNENYENAQSDLEVEYLKQVNELEAKADEKRKATSVASQRKAKMEEHSKRWETIIGDTSTWKDMSLGLSYKTKTLRRILRKVVKDANGNADIRKADWIYDELETKYDHNEAQLKQESQKLKEVFFELNLNHAEDTYANMLGELRHNPETTLTEEVVKEYYEKHKGKIDTNKVNKAISEARKTFDGLLVRVNDVLREQGMKEIPYRKGYFPHFTNPKQGWLAKLLNWKTIDNEIPTSIAGLTEMFTPQRSWQSFNKQRMGDKTDYSLYQGLDTYIHGALDWIYHIDDIQSRRALENYLRYTHSDEGVKARIEEIKANDTYDAEEAQKLIDGVLAEANNPLSGLVRELMNRTNTLANKKSSMDRSMEDATNRKIYSTMTNLNNRINANMVVGSFSSALTNFIPMVQSWHQVSPYFTVRGLGDFVRSSVKDDGMVAKSDFLTNRLVEEEKLYQTNWDKISDKAAFMMNVIDNITSQTVWRSKYLQNIKEGMGEAQAIRDADQFSKNLIAGRSRGNAPTIFDAKNPLAKIFTAFQLEVANQYGYMFEDVPQDSKNTARLVKGYATAFLGAYAYNALYSSLVGRDAALDPIGIVEDLLKDLFDEDDEEESLGDELMDFGKSILEEVPFVGGLVGGGRVPMSSAFPYSGYTTPFESMLNDVDNKNWDSLGKEFLKPLYYLAMPVGGGQIKKTIEGLSMFSDEHPIAGSYTTSGNLRFPVEDTVGSRIKAGIFGQYASENARKYFDQEQRTLNPEQTEIFAGLDIPIEDYWEYRDNYNAFTDVKKKMNEAANADGATEEDIVRNRYFSSVSGELNDLYEKQKEIAKSDSPYKQQQLREIQDQMADILAKSDYESDIPVSVSGAYAEAGDRRFNYDAKKDFWYEIKSENDGEENWYYIQEQLSHDKLGISYEDFWNGRRTPSKNATYYAEYNGKRYNYDAEKSQWYEIREKNEDGSDNWYYQMEQEVTKGLGISYEEYWSKPKEYNYAYEKPGKYAISQAVGGYDDYMEYKDALENWQSDNYIAADKDAQGNSISGSRKKKVLDYINGLDLDYGERLILYRTVYSNKSDKRAYNQQIIDYLNERDDISYQEMKSILEELEMEVDSEGYITW